MTRVDTKSIRWATAIANRMTFRPHLREEFVSAAMEGLARAANRYDGRIPWLAYVSVEVTAAVRAEVRAWDLVHRKTRARIQRGEIPPIEEETFSLATHDRDDDGEAHDRVIARLAVESMTRSLEQQAHAVLRALYVEDMDASEVADDLGLTRRRVNQIRSEAFDSIREAA